MSKHDLAFGFKELQRAMHATNKRGGLTQRSTPEEYQNWESWNALMTEMLHTFQDILAEHRPINDEDAGTTDNDFTTAELIDRSGNDGHPFVEPLLCGAERLGIIKRMGADVWTVLEYDEDTIYHNTDLLRECRALATSSARKLTYRAAA